MAASTSSQQPSAPAFSLLNARRPSETFERGSFDNNIDDYREEPTAFSFIAPYENLNWWEKSYIVDWLVGIVLLALGSIIQNIPPPERDFDAKDLDISHPKRGSSVPGSLLWFLATVIPIGVFVLYNFFDTIGKYIYTRERIERNKLFGLRTHDLHNACLGWFVSITLTKVITNTFKVAVGRMRPDFLDRCKLSLITQYCTGDESAIIDGRKSFPSGHASMAFAAFTFLALYLATKLASLSWDSAPARYRLLKFVITFAPLAIAGLIAASRVRDNRHHPTDVVAGGLLGTLMAWASFRLYYRSPFNKDALAMRFPKWISDDERSRRVEETEAGGLFGP